MVDMVRFAMHALTCTSLTVGAWAVAHARSPRRLSVEAEFSLKGRARAALRQGRCELAERLATKLSNALPKDQYATALLTRVVTKCRSRYGPALKQALRDAATSRMLWRRRYQSLRAALRAAQRGRYSASQRLAISLLREVPDSERVRRVAAATMLAAGDLHGFTEQVAWWQHRYGLVAAETFKLGALAIVRVWSQRRRGIKHEAR